MLSGSKVIVAEIQSGFESRSITNFPTGTFSIALNDEISLPVPWNTTEFEMTSVLGQITGIDHVTVSRVQKDRMNHVYSVTFDSSIGDIPEMEVITSELVGSGNHWQVQSTNDDFQHITTSPSGQSTSEHYPHGELTNEIQRMTLKIGNEGTDDGMIVLGFMGYQTPPLGYNASNEEIVEPLESLPSIGRVKVSSPVNTALEVHWEVMFLPSLGGDRKNLLIFGNIPLISIETEDSNLDVEAETLQNGQKPFRVLVRPSEPSAYHTFATNPKGFPIKENIGQYRSKSQLRLQLRDRFLNTISARGLSLRFKLSRLRLKHP